MNNVSQLYTVGFCITADFADNRDGGFMDIGNYSSEEKAIKVLDMIHNAYQYAEETKCLGTGRNKPEFAFQMPHDSEVVADDGVHEEERSGSVE